MVAPGVVQLIVTLCAEVYVPATSEKVGVATTGKVTLPATLIVFVVVPDVAVIVSL